MDSSIFTKDELSLLRETMESEDSRTLIVGIEFGGGMVGETLNAIDELGYKPILLNMPDSSRAEDLAGMLYVGSDGQIDYSQRSDVVEAGDKGVFVVENLLATSTKNGIAALTLIRHNRRPAIFITLNKDVHFLNNFLETQNIKAKTISPSKRIKDGWVVDSL